MGPGKRPPSLVKLCTTKQAIYAKQFSELALKIKQTGSTTEPEAKQRDRTTRRQSTHAEADAEVHTTDAERKHEPLQMPEETHAHQTTTTTSTKQAQPKRSAPCKRGVRIYTCHPSA